MPALRSRDLRPMTSNPTIADAAPSLTTHGIQEVLSKAKELLADSQDLASVESALSAIAADRDRLDERLRSQLEEIHGLVRLIDENSPALEHLRSDGRFQLAVSDDKMVLSLTVEPPVAGGQAVTAEQVLERLRGQQIELGVDMAAITQAVEEGRQSLSEIPIVRGRPPEHGRDGTFELFGRGGADQALEPARWPRPERQRDDLLICLQEDRILRIVPPEPGRAGYDAVGHTLQPPQPRPFEIEPGPNVRLEEEQFFAECSGVVVFTQRRIEVRPLLQVTHELMRTDGPIVFDGDVHLKAAVRDGAEVRASGDIWAFGPVESAHLESSGGSIRLYHGVAGRHRGLVRASQDVITRYAENARIVAGRDIDIEDGALHSHLTAGRDVLAVRGRGQLFGGVLMAGRNLQAKQLGAMSEVPTEVVLGLPLDKIEKVSEITHQMLQTRQRQQDAEELADRMLRQVGKAERFQPPELTCYLDLRKLQLTCEWRIRDLEQQRDRILDTSVRDSRAYLDARTLLPNVKIRIGSHSLHNDQTRRSCRVEFDRYQKRIAVRGAGSNEQSHAR